MGNLCGRHLRWLNLSRPVQSMVSLIVLSLVCTSSCPMARYSASISSIPILVLVLFYIWGCAHVCVHACTCVHLWF